MKTVSEAKRWHLCKYINDPDSNKFNQRAGKQQTPFIQNDR